MAACVMHDSFVGHSDQVSILTNLSIFICLLLSTLFPIHVVHTTARVLQSDICC